jgi:ribosomal protein S18 acetylase RimI-like enzyme
MRPQSPRHVVVIEAAGTVAGYTAAWPESDAYFIEIIGVDPELQGRGLGRRLIDMPKLRLCAFACWPCGSIPTC